MKTSLANKNSNCYYNYHILSGLRFTKYVKTYWKINQQYV